MKRYHLVEFQVARDISVRGTGVGWVGFNASDLSNSHIRFATAAAAKFSVNNPVLFYSFGLRKVPIWDVVAAANVVVAIGDGTGVENVLLQPARA